MTDISVRKEGQHLTVYVKGDWTLKNFSQCLSACTAVSASEEISEVDQVLIDGSLLGQLDTAGSKPLADLILSTASLSGEKSFSLINFSVEKQSLFNIVVSRLQKYYALPARGRKRKNALLRNLGRMTVSSLSYLNQLFNFFGLVADAILRLILNPSLFRPRELITQLEEACIKSIPVISLVTFLIGVVITYLMAMQVEKYGGHIFVVNGVALAMCRELSPVIVAVVMAGRSGSAYTAQIGAMRLNEEVDAIISLGLSVQQVLVLPRFFALILSMPLLVFIGDLVGILGGIVTAEYYLGLTHTTFIERLQTALPVKHFVVGMIKAPVFAAIIAVIGCRRGLTTEMNARSVGLSTTATVVESIVLVILLNAAFAVLFAKLGV